MLWLLVVLLGVVACVPLYEKGMRRRAAGYVELLDLESHGLERVDDDTVEGMVNGVHVRVVLEGGESPRLWSRLGHALAWGFEPIQPLVAYAAVMVMVLLMLVPSPWMAWTLAWLMVAALSTMFITTVAGALVGAGGELVTGVLSQGVRLVAYADIPGLPELDIRREPSSGGIITGDEGFDVTVQVEGSAAEALSMLTVGVRRQLRGFRSDWRVEEGTVVMDCESTIDPWVILKRAADIAGQLEVRDVVSGLLGRIDTDPHGGVRLHALRALEGTSRSVAAQIHADRLAGVEESALSALLGSPEPMLVHIALTRLVEVGIPRDLEAVMAVDDGHAELRERAVAAIRERASGGTGGLSLALGGALSAADSRCG